MGPRLAFWTFAAAAPALVALGVVVATGHLGVGAGLLAAVFTLLVTGCVVHPLLSGILAVRRGVEVAEDAAPPAVRTLLPTVEELWLAIARLLRVERQKRNAVAAERDAARAILSAVPDPLVVLDQGRRIEAVNDAASKLFGSGVVGHDLGAALRHPALLEAADAILGGGPARLVGLPLAERHFDARIAATASGGAVIALSDVTALKRSDELRADFVANASHELRTPLASLVGFIETLRGPARDDEEAREKFLAIMHDQASRMARLVDDLLSLSRIEMREHLAPTERLDLRLVLGSVAETLQLRAKSRQMRIELDLPEDLPPVIGDADELTQAIQNLVDNAIKYSPDGAEVSVSCQRIEDPIACR